MALREPQEGPMRDRARSKYGRSVLTVAVVAGLALSMIGCVPAQAGSSCDPEVQAFGLDGEIILRCHNSYAAYRVWLPERFNEQPVTAAKLGALFRLAAGQMTEVERVAVVGDEVLHGIHSIDPSATNPKPYSVVPALEWPTWNQSRPCNRVGEPVVQPVIDKTTGVVTAKVTWTERVGESRFQFCDEPQLRVRVNDANGDEVPLGVLIA